MPESLTHAVHSDKPASDSLISRSFIGYLLMGFLTAVNDSMFRWLVVPIAKYRVGLTPGLTDAERESSEAMVLAMGLGSFILPAILFAPWSGWIADRFSKRSVTLWLKAAEVVLMLLGVLAISVGSLPAMFAVLFLTGAQSALLSTAKFGIIPEIVPREKLSAANGLTGLVTLIAVIAGTVVGNTLYQLTQPDGLPQLWISSTALLGVAVTGLLGAFLIQEVVPADPDSPFPWNPLARSLRDCRLVVSDRPILRVTLGIAFFWSLAALAQLNVDTFVINRLHLSQSDVGTFLAVLSLGVGIGSVLAGWWSGGRVELGMVPLGTALMAAACLSAWLLGGSGWAFGISLLLIGAGGGLFNVPLNAYLQDRSPHQSLGAILAAGNQLTSIGVLGVSFLFPFLRNTLHCG
ncbi:MAG: MFS transporter, partial [Planctomycetaceae bacterium]